MTCGLKADTADAIDWAVWRVDVNVVAFGVTKTVWNHLNKDPETNLAFVHRYELHKERQCISQ
jgi:hypothetical protein